MGVFLRGVACTSCDQAIVVDHAQTIGQCDRCGRINSIKPAISKAGQRAAAVLADKAWSWEDESLALCLTTSGADVRFLDVHDEWNKVKMLAEMYAGRRDPAGSLDEQHAAT